LKTSGDDLKRLVQENNQPPPLTTKPRRRNCKLLNYPKPQDAKPPVDSLISSHLRRAILLSDDYSWERREINERQ